MMTTGNPRWIAIQLISFFWLAWSFFSISVHALAGEMRSDAKSGPNIVFFLVDDLGWTDLSCFGSTFYETPNIDRLCQSGMKFTNAYTAASVCSPTRGSIMTGKHPVRLDITDWIPGMSGKRDSRKLIIPQDTHNMPLEEITLAEALKKNNYQTFFAGKWHLGEEEAFWPEHQGFDINIGGWSKGSPMGGYYAPYTNPRLSAEKKGEYLTERLTEESLRFLEKRNPSRPFLLYLSFYNVHTPIQAYRKKIDHFRQKAEESFAGETPRKQEGNGQTRLRQDNAAFASMVAAVDVAVGRVLEKIVSQQLEQETIVIFFSDNGGLATLRGNRGIGPTSNLPLRAGKGWLYEGGIRVPLIMRVPGVTEAGSVCDEPVVSTDFYPTLLELLGLPAMPRQHADGVSLVPLLEGDDSLERDTLYWHYPHYHGSAWPPGAAVRHGNWKLIEFFEDDDIELYRLDDDLGEKNDLAATHPEKARQLKKKLHDWLDRLDAKMPKPNPDYAPRSRIP